MSLFSYVSRLLSNNDPWRDALEASPNAFPAPRTFFGSLSDEQGQHFGPLPNGIFFSMAPLRRFFIDPTSCQCKVFLTRFPRDLLAIICPHLTPLILDSYLAPDNGNSLTLKTVPCVFFFLP